MSSLLARLAFITTFVFSLPLQDLGSSDGPPRNWKGIGIAMVVILAVMSLVTLSVVVLTPGKKRGGSIKVESAIWIHVALRTREGHVLTFTLSNNLTTTLLDNSSLVGRLLVMSGFLYVCSRDLLELSPPERETTELQYASWGPQGNQLAFVFDGDIYYKPSVTSDSLRLTSTDEDQKVLNGLSDWTYEEEVLLTYAAHWWSMDGARLAYLRINNSVTPVMEIPHFLGGLYPSNMIFPYPKAGSSIPTVSLFVVNLYGPAHTLEMLPPDSLRSRENYISMVSWISSTRLAVRWLNRAQNQSVLCVCEATTGACSEDLPLFTSDGSMFYTILPAKQGARGEFHHIAGLTVQVSNFPSFIIILCLTKVQIFKFTSVNYFLSTEKSRESRHLYSVDLNGVFQRRCISCGLIDGCGFFKAIFSPNQTHFILYCLVSVFVFLVKLRRFGCVSCAGYVVLEDNSLLSAVKNRLPFMIHDIFLVIQRRSFITKLAYLVFLVTLSDGTPGSQTVTEEFSLGWPQVLCSTHSVALAWVDGRSGVGRGQKTVAVDPRKLGTLRVKDYLRVVESVKLHCTKLPYIDYRRIALFGKALGGYLALKMLAATDNLFQCAAAVAPITDFRFYSEFRHKRTLNYIKLHCNDDVFSQTASVLEEVNKLKEENFLIVHGTADARVHFQHSAELLSRLVKVEANYSLQLYPDEGHVLRELRSVRHFQRTVVNYLQNCLKHSTLLDAPEEEEEEDD
uniref:Inactive dipeptidyl peptidase 10-like n=1 Tax=Poecilia latipinna TaxID=48699 RepID=A0A3B3UTJ1_9TELE